MSFWEDNPESSPARVPSGSRSSDQRIRRRFPVDLPVLVKWTDSEHHRVIGKLRDVNDNGVFFHAEADIPIGQPVELTFTVPRELTGPESFRFQGTVVRREGTTSARVGYAAKVTNTELMVVEEDMATLAAAMPSQSEAAEPPPESDRSRKKKVFWVTLLALLVLLVAFVVARLIGRQHGEVRSQVDRTANLTVWADQQTGLYHCPGSDWYGKTKMGKYMVLRDAQYEGFRPAFGKTCSVAAPPSPR